MTRINVVPPSELTRQHLVAEYRELPRIFKLARRCKDAPEQYKLGSGHMKFFFDKLEYLVNRQQALIDEMLRRGYSPKHTDAQSLRMLCDDEGLYNDYIPTPHALKLNRERIQERLNG
ncbi:MAG: pyrimidine dimer DNA glycosylase/endonuclease V [Pseudomonadales bacterium]|nr:pyrimidine dimer DNA glycosylase/endonuclease V [Pseudomonadales bacterium]